MTNLRQAAQPALEALESGLAFDAHSAVLQNLREALEQTEQEPVAFVNADNLQGLTLGYYGYVEIYTDESAGRVPLYTTPPAAERKPPPEWEAINNIIAEYGLQAISFVAEWKAAQREWVGLTDEELEVLFEKYGHKTGVLVGAVQDKLKEKNT